MVELNWTTFWCMFMKECLMNELRLILWRVFGNKVVVIRLCSHCVFFFFQTWMQGVCDSYASLIAHLKLTIYDFITSWYEWIDQQRSIEFEGYKLNSFHHCPSRLRYSICILWMLLETQQYCKQGVIVVPV
jgi:hypothetical protein